MEWKFDSRQPIYAQLVEQMTVKIVTGMYEPGSRIGSVRDLAQEAGVNPNTMQRALAGLEDSGLVYSQRTSGRFITEDMNLIEFARSRLAAEKTDLYVGQMKELGFTKKDMVKLLEEYRDE
jgi:GntR family transcriptional regulator